MGGEESTSGMESQQLVCVVEIPKGSRNKYEYDDELGGIRLDRFVSASVVYRTDYGTSPTRWRRTAIRSTCSYAFRSRRSRDASCRPRRAASSRATIEEARERFRSQHP
jgi:hypothetical protein